MAGGLPVLEVTLGELDSRWMRLPPWQRCRGAVSARARSDCGGQDEKRVKGCGRGGSPVSLPEANGGVLLDAARRRGNWRYLPARKPVPR